MKNFSYEYDFHVHENEPGGKCFHLNGFAHKTCLDTREKTTWKCPIQNFSTWLQLEFLTLALIINFLLYMYIGKHVDQLLLQNFNRKVR